MHIFLAEDNEVNVKVFDKLLERKIMGPGNYTLTRVANGVEALAYLANPHSRRPDIFFLDFSMPKMDGFEVLRRIRTQHPFVNNPYIQSIPIIMMGAYVSKGDERWRQEGANDLMIKPIRASHMRHMLLRWTQQEVVPSQAVGFGPGRVVRRPVWGPMPLRAYRGPKSML